jgi:dihydroorotase
MGSSTGNMLVDDISALEAIFSESPVIITTHCEDEETIRENLKLYKEKFGDNIPIHYHPIIRSAEACYKSSSLAVKLAQKHNARLHILHLSTEEELQLFDSETVRTEKRITAEACIHHLWFQETDYEKYGTRIKWNPAVKTEKDRKALIEGLKENKIDIIATDHAPHTLDEKKNNYLHAPSGGPMVQHSLQAMLDLHKSGEFSLEQIVDKMCHAPADIFNIKKRGYIRKGYYADLVLVDQEKPYKVSPENILYKCGWSPMEGHTFSSTVTHTFINGSLVYENGEIYDTNSAQRLEFDR